MIVQQISNRKYSTSAAAGFAAVIGISLHNKRIKLAPSHDSIPNLTSKSHITIMLD
jgi:hypothetical protein